MCRVEPVPGIGRVRRRNGWTTTYLWWLLLIRNCASTSCRHTGYLGSNKMRRFRSRHAGSFRGSLRCPRVLGQRRSLRRFLRRHETIWNNVRNITLISMTFANWRWRRWRHSCRHQLVLGDRSRAGVIFHRVHVVVCCSLLRNRDHGKVAAGVVNPRAGHVLRSEVRAALHLDGPTGRDAAGANDRNRGRPYPVSVGRHLCRRGRMKARLDVCRTRGSLRVVSRIRSVHGAGKKTKQSILVCLNVQSNF